MSDKEKNSEEVEETFSAESEENESAKDEETVEEINEEGVQPVSEVEDLKTQLSEMEDNYLRASAEITNMNNRFRNERETLQKYRSQDLGKKLLPALDNLERAVATEVEGEQNENLKKGVEMTLESLRSAMQEEGIEEIPAQGEIFDPTMHQAVQSVPATEDQPAETVVEVLQKGYKLYDRVLRASMVVVAQ
ncbi:nucleotide exchange factor GrpE [Tetragenococcus muriaticus]|uniref:Protein GrpE n=2 Tax=Tetragenococcus muriaticus TaxID=64642 RepID=A0A091C0D3_9ENTE|nr:nucleotide exchange factor GrpE [Tetragenococcus muriaticus]KFN91306.1 GrpE family heat shock protein [Tetragenococcus muriaticus 3MR10-3]KFN91754.1 GrpE family heat shock protein [Tetragenococcus muriaticus PMC-11-5]GMA47259.1 protein GrpE [Tetragenococcus muriaticus]GMA48576.1 protein GrpE [Tetragenococcus muriaticus]GMA48616.1 protein GrpE [Tetragenococcus muriaticus]